MDELFISYEDSAEIGPLTSQFDVSGGALEIVAGYQPHSWKYTQLLFGARRVSLQADLDVSPGATLKQNMHWLDPIAGFRYDRPISPRCP